MFLKCKTKSIINLSEVKKWSSFLDVIFKKWKIDYCLFGEDTFPELEMDK